MISVVFGTAHRAVAPGVFEKLLDRFDDFADGFTIFFREFDLVDEGEEHGGEGAVEVAVGEGFELAADVLFTRDGGGEAVREAGGVAGDVAFFLKAFEEAFHGGVKRGLVLVVEGVDEVADGAGLLFPEEAEEGEFGFGGKGGAQGFFDGGGHCVTPFRAFPRDPISQAC